jgi:hypothetical protein
VAFYFYWFNDSTEEPPCVALYLPDEVRFPPRNLLLDRVRAHLKGSGFTDYYEGDDQDFSVPLWRDIRLFNGQAGVDLPAILSAILKGFQDLMEVEKHIEEVVRSLPAPPPPYERELKIVAILDTEWTGEEPARKITELAIVNVAYDPVKDEVVGILEEYCMNKGEELDKVRARTLLGRACRIVAHNCAGDESLLAQELPGIENDKWICSYRGIEWKRLTGARAASQNALASKFGIHYDQQHHACADAHDLKRLLAQKHDGGRTYLGRLLDDGCQSIS